MEFIDKKGRRDWAHSILQSFLNRCLDCNPYPADLYEALKSDTEPDTTINPNQETTYKRLLIGILDDSCKGEGYPSGIGRCCYCMRTIRASETHSTLEHIIPNKTSKIEDYEKYFSVSSNLERDQRVMVYRELFLSRHKKTAPPFPHNVAYENLVASCDGSLPKGSTQHLCCNNPRGDQFVPPFLFMNDIHQEFIYNSQRGTVTWKKNSQIDKRVRAQVINDILNLNCGILRMIRMIWSFLAENGQDCEISPSKKKWVIDTLYQRCDETDKEEILNFNYDNYWSLLEEYRYFNDKNKFSYPL